MRPPDSWPSASCSKSLAVLDWLATQVVAVVVHQIEGEERQPIGVLRHQRVVRVTVRLEKLDVGPGGVGVEITRERTAETANVHQFNPVGRADLDPKAAE